MRQRKQIAVLKIALEKTQGQGPKINNSLLFSGARDNGMDNDQQLALLNPCLPQTIPLLRMATETI